MKVVSYYNVVPSKNKSQEKYDILTKFIQGVNAAGDTGILHQGYDLLNCDVGVIQGWTHEKGKNAPHLSLRQNVIDIQKRRNKFVCTADSNLFLYANKSNKPHHYLRYSLNDVFPNTGIYFDKNVDPMRWRQISNDTGIFLDDYKTVGSDIVICCQRNGGWSMGSQHVLSWIVNTIELIRKHSDRTIVIRPHPGDKRSSEYLRNPVFKKLKNVKISNSEIPLEEDLRKAWAVVNHNSSSIVGPIIMGYHAFITDPANSQCSSVAHTGFENIESPKEFDRQQWVERISMFHWKFTELENGTAWRHFRNYCQ